jgi:ADP-dependent NAD(P)H-hydrate dehydratase / NAD(P)H-hydrate epimerase
MIVVTAEQMREMDRLTIQRYGVPSLTLMERAGTGITQAIIERFARNARKGVLIVAGKGNNGGDGFVVARRLGARAEALLLGPEDGVAGDARTHLLACRRSGVRVAVVEDAEAWGRALARLDESDLIVDAILGTGLRSAPSGLAADAIAAISRRFGAGVPVVAVDMPSGLSSDVGTVDWPAARATVTVTFAAPKRGHVLSPACHQVGELVVAEIGIAAESVASASPSLFLLDDTDAAGAFPLRRRDAHKGDFGHLLVVAGSVGKTGAAVLSAGGALRAGAGLVTVATPEPCLTFVGAARPEAMTEPLPATGRGGLAESGLARLVELAGERDAVVVGPGLGQDPGTRALVRAFVGQCPVPMVIDADGLNALAARGEEASGLGALRREIPAVLTPHPGEMARLVGGRTSDVQKDRPGSAVSLARRTGAVVVLKGERTLVAEPEGRAAVTAAGNPGMATGGTGDVLSGVVGSLLARHGALLAATAAVVVHGRAGDLAARARGEEGMTAGDVVEALPDAIESVRRAAGGGASAS